MIESPVLRELKEEWTREGMRDGKREGKREGKLEGERAAIAKFLEARWQLPAREAQAEVRSVPDDQLDEILKLAATCPSLASFRKRIAKRKA
jgi:predicted transposase YdaD